MIKRNLLSLLVLGLMSTGGFAQHNLSLNIEGVASEDGNICFAIYNDEGSFLKFDKVYKSGSEKAVKGKTAVNITDLPDGDYAIAIFHDANGNKNLDTNMLGIPKEQIAFSKGKMKMFGPPKFDECVFTFNSNMEMNISLQ
ncbi:hypothetical protein LCGC14_0354590 [marine sediment metagenome]|uniref:DUF2141 domain-containing protein n=1 Tax=marine sediment metagenome TaxID=412755 RepID=A0A0F9WHY9_9ZZZZ|nr:DUF2141 domain-containing protein [Maribacter sp.]HDZ04649.1 DUF2141 domain-containing protein [Maribacter sp.]HEA79148.1 DUF2141 domain-containing protein [Maribacter sp.]